MADAEGANLILLSPQSRGSTWDAVLGEYGADVAFLDQALWRVMDRHAVDPGGVAVAGFSDGASYALGLGVANGDLFGRLLTFSPGFNPSGPRVGRPRIFVSHGRSDEVLPIGPSSRRIVPALRDDGYDVRYDEFDGGHDVPPHIRSSALAWLQSES